MLPSITLEYTETGSLQERMDAVMKAGFTAINLASTQCKHLLRSRSIETDGLKLELQQHGLAVDWVHSPFIRSVLYDGSDEKYPLTIGALKAAIIIAAELEARSLIVHPFDKNFSAERITHPDAINQLIEAFSILVDYGRWHGVLIAVENIDEPYSAQILTRLLQQVDGLKMCFDTGHAERWQAWENYLPVFLPRISALHIHDNHGVKDEHLVPGDGTIDFVPFFRALKSIDYSGYLGIECDQKIGHYAGDFKNLPKKVWDRIERLVAAAAR